MSLENDKCKFCNAAQKQLQQTNTSLECLKTKKCDNNDSNLKDRLYSRPILFTHFPLFRLSDEICPHDIDSDPSETKSIFREKYDSLSKEATKQVFLIFLNFWNVSPSYYLF